MYGAFTSIWCKDFDLAGQMVSSTTRLGGLSFENMLKERARKYLLFICELKGFGSCRV